MRRVRFAMLLLTLGPTIAPAAPADADLKRLQEQNRKQQEQYLKTIAEAPGEFEFADLCQASRQGSRLVVKSALPPALSRQGQVRVKVKGFDGVAVVQVPSRENGNNFSLQIYNWSDADAVCVTTTLASGPQYFNLNRSWQFRDGHQNISLNQYENQDMGDGLKSRVQLSVYRQTSRGGVPVRINAVAPDFPTLRREQRAALDTYVRPLLRELKLESVMAVDPLLAQQVFADDWTPERAVRLAVEGLLARLDSDVFEERDKALAELTRTGRAGALVVHHLDRKKLTPQQNMMLDTFVSPYVQIETGEARRLARDVDFLLDCLYSNELMIRQTATQRLESLAGGPIGFDPRADPAGQSAAIEALRLSLLSGSATRPASRPATRPS